MSESSHDLPPFAMLCRRSIGLAALVALAIAASAVQAAEPEVILLWPQGAPGAKGEEPADKPALTVYLAPADQACGTGMVICPGGGYGHLAVGHEGKEVAAWLNSLGIHAFVLQYRLAPRYGHPAPLTDALRAMRIVRSRAAEWKLDAARIGIIGFSAGGHLTSSVGTHFTAGDPNAEDPIEKASSRPDFMVLGYPVITMDDSFTHKGSKKNLLGENPDPALVELFSNEKQVTAETPPTFLFHTTTDTVVLPENSAHFYLALRKAKVPCELHIYAEGRHGVGLAQGDPVLKTWPERCADWLKKIKAIP